MRLLIFFLLVLHVSLPLYSQTEQPLETDSLQRQQWANLIHLIAHYHHDKALVITLVEHSQQLDTFSVKSIHYRKHRKNVRLRLNNNTSKKMDTSLLWGYISAFGECQRIYKGEKYILWHRNFPYTYKQYGPNQKLYFFFSKDLTSEVLPFTAENVKAQNDSSFKLAIQEYLIQENLNYSRERFYLLNSIAKLHQDFLLLHFYALAVVCSDEEFYEFLISLLSPPKSSRKKHCRE